MEKKVTTRIVYVRNPVGCGSLAHVLWHMRPLLPTAKFGHDKELSGEITQMDVAPYEYTIDSGETIEIAS